MTLLLAWARAHWKPLAWYGSIIALSFASGWLFHRPPPQPSVALREDTSVQKASVAEAQTTDSKGPSVTTIDETLYDPPTVNLPTDPPACPAMKLIAVPMPGPVREVRHTVIETGPEVVHTQTVERVQEQERQQVSLIATPQPLPRWALGAGLEDPLGSRKVNLSIGFRLIGPVWLRAGFTPARGTPGATIGAEVQW